MTLFLAALATPSILIQGGLLVDGSGSKGRIADLRLRGDRIVAVGALSREAGETVISAKGLVVSPGFVDAHSHADGGIEKDPQAVSQVSQGITTAVVGQDGIGSMSVAELFQRLAKARPAINFAAFSGQGGIATRVMGSDFKRSPTTPEIEQMKAFVVADMRAGALGLSSGLEYDPGYYASTSDLVELSKVARSGVYISHLRDEGNRVFEAIAELLEIGRSAGIRTQISHIKLATQGVWGRAPDVLRRLGQNTTADVYPYTFWQSTISALSPSRDWGNRAIWVSALADVGGPSRVRLTRYSPDPRWEGKTLEALSRETGRDPITLIQEILAKTRRAGTKGEESVAVQAMQESDLRRFIAHPRVMFCSDGSIGGTHPRSAGSFPRVLGHYVRQERVLPLEEAVRKMTSLPCQTFGLVRRGMLKKGYVADVVIFDPKTIRDRATAEDPTRLSVGVRDVFVSGVPVWRNSRPTTGRSGRVVLRGK